MPRKRKLTDSRLPTYVYPSKGRYVLKHYDADLKRVVSETVLCKTDAPISKVWQIYLEITKKKQVGTLRWLAVQYFSSPEFQSRAPSTQQDYKSCYANVCKMKVRGGLFVDLQLARYTPKAMKGYRLQRQKEGAPVRGNRELAFMSLVFSWAYSEDLLPKGMLNPFKGAGRKKERPRQRYVQDDEYSDVYDLAERPWYLRPAMEIAYICRARKSEVLDFQRHDILDQGLQLRRIKGSKHNIVKWSPRLRAAVDACLHKPSIIPSMYLFHDKHGGKILTSTFGSAWGRHMRDYIDKGGTRFTFHDLKAKGISDDTGDRQKGSGHKSAAMVALYSRKKDEVDPVK